MGLSPGDKEETQVHALLSVFEPNNRRLAANHRKTVKEVTWLVIDYDEPAVYRVEFLPLNLGSLETLLTQ